MTQEKIQLENVFVVTDDVHLDFGSVRIKTKGSAGGHNGLKDIQEKLNTQQYTRFRFGVGGNYAKGRQADFVLGSWTKEEESQLIERIPLATKAIVSFGTDGINNTMNSYNGK
jgi:PTH1 family peptidyl-tRNA hydrolase